MIYGFLNKVDREFISTAEDLLKSISLKLIIAIGVLYFIWAYLVFFARPFPDTIRVAPVTVTAALSTFLALYFLKRHYLGAQILWLVGLAAGVTLGLAILKVPEIAYCFILLPMLAVVTIGLPAGLVGVVTMIVVVQWLNLSSVVAISTSARWVIYLGGLLGGFIGWASTNAFFSLTQWAIFSYEQARKNMEEARDQRAELRQVQEDLIHANRELGRLSERLKAMNQVAEEARRVKEEFVAKVSHELRTPLNMIIGFCEMITQAPKIYGKRLPPLLLSDITAIQRNSHHLLGLVNDVLDLSQIEAGRMALSKQWIVMQEVLNEAAAAVRPLFVSKGLYLETEMPPEPIQLYADNTRIREVILNLLSNAGRFTDHGGVRLRTWVEEARVIVCVTDTGPGIAPDDQERIFEPFQQLDNSMQRKYSGSGLGLSISKQFVEMHDGKMWLESRLGEGTSFFFSLPRETPIILPPGSETSATRWINPYQVFEGQVRRSKAPAPAWVPRFVLVETGESLHKLFDRYLDNAEVVSCPDTRSAIEELKNRPAQALVINSHQREEAAAQITAEIGQIPFGTPVVTCWVPGSEDAARQLGVLRYMVKPVTREMLLSTLKELGKQREVKTVLLVEDNPDTLQLFMRILSSGDEVYQVIRAMTGQQALAMLRERRPDVMLLDLVLPGMNGFQVIKEKSLDPAIRDIPVVVVSSLDPTGSPILSDFLNISKSGGLSVKDLMACISAISEILYPRSQPAARAHLADSSA
jgi:signal transduction histidine kinase/CheY-like chemotaxis protein